MLDIDRRRILRYRVKVGILALGTMAAALISNLVGNELACDGIIAVWAVYLIVFILHSTADLRALHMVDDDRLYDDN